MAVLCAGTATPVKQDGGRFVIAAGNGGRGQEADGNEACPQSGQWLHVDGPKENFMLALIQTVDLALGIYSWFLIGAAIFSWLYAFNVVNSRNQFVNTVGNGLYRITEPVLAPVRRIMPDLGGVDISPIVVLLIIYFLRQLLANNIAPMLLG
jgi:YggT family protein